MPKKLRFVQGLMKVMPEQVTLLFILGLLVLIACYIPGLSGGFLLDDFGTLNQLGDLNRIDSFEKLKHFVFSGVTGPSGRPVSLLTFALNAQTWPADPFPFLVTNLAIHLLNSLLCYVFIGQLIPKNTETNSRIKYLPALAAIAWALHPMQVSTVLYVVQRMTMLAAMFGFISLIAFIRARVAFEASRNALAVLYLATSGLAFIAGYFSKENILVLFPLLLLIEAYLRSQNERIKSKQYDAMMLICVLPCALIVCGYPVKLFIENLVVLYKSGAEQNYGRSYTMIERLLTEQRVIGDYIKDIFFPKIQTAGVFYDGYPVSKTMFKPISTFMWAAIHIVVLISGVLLRKRYGFIFFGIGWFYISHLLESTTPMLEIKFDHRNYVAILGPVFIVVNLILRVPRPAFCGAMILVVFCIYSLFLYYSSSLWGNPLEASKIWVTKNPNSVRANEYAAKMAYETNVDDVEAKQYLKEAINISKSTETELKYVAVFCDTYNGKAIDWDDVSQRIASEVANWSLFGTVKSMVDATVKGRCKLLDYDAMAKISKGYRSHPVYQANLSSMLMEQYEIQIALYYGKSEEAKKVDQRADAHRVPLAYKMIKAQLFASHGMQEYAAQRLREGIAMARYLLNESDFTIRNAEEVLALILRDLEE
jgi:hypothetical protein